MCNCLASGIPRSTAHQIIVTACTSSIIKPHLHTKISCACVHVRARVLARARARVCAHADTQNTNAQSAYVGHPPQHCRAACRHETRHMPPLYPVQLCTNVMRQRASRIPQGQRASSKTRAVPLRMKSKDTARALDGGHGVMEAKDFCASQIRDVPCTYGRSCPASFLAESICHTSSCAQMQMPQCVFVDAGATMRVRGRRCHNV